MQKTEAIERAGTLLGSLHTGYERGDASDTRQTAQQLWRLGEVGLGSLKENLRVFPKEVKFLRLAAAMEGQAAPLVPQLVENFERLAPMEEAVSKAYRDAFVQIGPAAAAAIPVLVNALSEYCNHAEDAARALAGIGTPALPALAEVLRTGNGAARSNALTALRDMGTSAASLLPLLEELKDTPPFKHTRVVQAIKALQEWEPQTRERLCVPV